MFQTTVSLSRSLCLAYSSHRVASKLQARNVVKTSSASDKSGSASSTTHPRDSKTCRCPLTASFTAASKGKPNPFDHAIRTPLKSRPSGCRNRLPSSVITRGERGSGPARTLSIKAASATVRAIGPSTASVNQPVFLGQVGTRPKEGRNPTTLQKLAGLRKEPPWSLPSASGIIPHARATAAPPLLPPQVFVRSYGFRVRPNTALNVCEPAPNSGVFVLPTQIAPAFRSRSTSSESTVGIASL